MTAATKSRVPDRTRVVGRRCVQYLLDFAIVTVPVLAIVFAAAILLFPVVGLRGLIPFAIALLVAMFVLRWAGTAIVHVWWPHRHAGRTPGMRWLGIRIITINGAQPPLKAYVVRALLQVVDSFLFGIVGIVVMLANDQHQRFGDVVAGTLVVRAERDDTQVN